MLLVDAGASVLAENHGALSPVKVATAAGKLDLVLWLIGKGAPVAGQDEEGETLMFPAARGGNAELIRRLAEEGLSVQASLRASGRTPLFAAVEANQTEAIRTLLDLGADPEHEDQDIGSWYPPLLFAAEHAEPGTMRFLLEAGLNVNVTSRFGNTALILAAGKGRTEIVDLLLEYDADPALAADNGDMALHLAAGREDGASAVQSLLAAGADPLALDGLGMTAGHVAVDKNASECLTLLLDSGVDPDIPDFYGRGLLNLARELGHQEIAALLEERGARLLENAGSETRFIPGMGYFKTAREKKGCILPLHGAVMQGRLTEVRRLLEAGADPNETRGCDDSAIILAARRGYTEIARALLAAGADPNGNGTGALQHCIIGGHGELLELLLQAGAEVGRLNNSDSFALEAAAMYGFPDAIPLLLKYGADVNQKNKSGISSLFRAICAGNAKAVALLEKAGATPLSAEDLERVARMQNITPGRQDMQGPSVKPSSPRQSLWSRVRSLLRR